MLENSAHTNLKSQAEDFLAVTQLWLVAGGASGRPSKHLVGAIVGSVVGAIALALSVAALYLYVARKWRRRKLPGKSSLDYLPAALAMQKGTSIDSSGFQSTLDGGDVMFERTHAGELWLLGQGRFGKASAGSGIAFQLLSSHVDCRQHTEACLQYCKTLLQGWGAKCGSSNCGLGSFNKPQVC